MCLGVGECSMGRCFAGMGNCDGNNRNGCETDLMTDPNQCGACVIRCLSGSCKRGFCMGSAIIGVDVGALHALVALSTLGASRAGATTPAVSSATGRSRIDRSRSLFSL